jgi:hypothetical protein
MRSPINFLLKEDLQLFDVQTGKSPTSSHFSSRGGEEGRGGQRRAEGAERGLREPGGSQEGARREPGGRVTSPEKRC